MTPELPPTTDPHQEAILLNWWRRNERLMHEGRFQQVVESCREQVPCCQVPPAWVRHFLDLVRAEMRKAETPATPGRPAASSPDEPVQHRDSVPSEPPVNQTGPFPVEWHYTENGQRAASPVSDAQLRQLAATGKVKPTDMVWKDGMAGWATARMIPGVFGSDPVASGPQTLVDPRPTPAGVAADQANWWQVNHQLLQTGRMEELCRRRSGTASSLLRTYSMPGHALNVTRLIVVAGMSSQPLRAGPASQPILGAVTTLAPVRRPPGIPPE
jgi:hypothetical protein